MTSSRISSTLPKAAPSPRLWASQASPRPAAMPPSMLPQGLRVAAAAAPVAPAAPAVVALWPGLAGAAGGVAWRCVTLADWRPNDLPPPMRRASASNVKAPNITMAISSVSSLLAMFLSVICVPPGLASAGCRPGGQPGFVG